MSLARSPSDPTPPAVSEPRPDPGDGDSSYAELLQQIADLQRTVESMAPIEQAKGASMVIYGLTEEAAFALLRWYSHNYNIKLGDIAAGLTGQSEPEPLCDQATEKLSRVLESITNGRHHDVVPLPTQNDRRGDLLDHS